VLHKNYDLNGSVEKKSLFEGLKGLDAKTNWLAVNRQSQSSSDLVSSVEFNMGGSEDRNWTRETEESPLLEAIARERLVKTQQAGKDLACAMVICELWRWAVAL
jgi:hypothetical protein